MMKTATVLVLLLASATAFTAPQFATRAVGGTKKVVAKKVVAKKVVAKKVVAKKVVAKKVVAKKPVFRAPASKGPPASKGYPSIRDQTESFSLGKISGGGNKAIAAPVFVHPTVNTSPPPSFDYKEAAKGRLTKNQVFAYDDGLTLLERKQKSSIPAFLTGSAKSSSIKSTVRNDIEEQAFAFGLDADRFQLLFITAFGIFTLVGCLSGSVSLD